MPSSTARWMAATDSASSWGPHPPCEALPPIAQAPSPRTVTPIPCYRGAVSEAPWSASPGERANQLRVRCLLLGASCQVVEDFQRLGDDLVHVVVLVRRQATNERDFRRFVGQELVSLVELRVLGPRDGVVRIPLCARALADDGRLGVLLPGQVLELGAARVRDVLARIVDDGSGLLDRFVVRLELEFE